MTQFQKARIRDISHFATKVRIPSKSHGPHKFFWSSLAANQLTTPCATLYNCHQIIWWSHNCRLIILLMIRQCLSDLAVCQVFQRCQACPVSDQIWFTMCALSLYCVQCPYLHMTKLRMFLKSQNTWNKIESTIQNTKCISSEQYKYKYRYKYKH